MATIESITPYLYTSSDRYKTGSKRSFKGNFNTLFSSSGTVDEMFSGIGTCFDTGTFAIKHMECTACFYFLATDGSSKELNIALPANYIPLVNLDMAYGFRQSDDLLPSFNDMLFDFQMFFPLYKNEPAHVIRDESTKELFFEKRGCFANFIINVKPQFDDGFFTWLAGKVTTEYSLTFSKIIMINTFFMYGE